MSRRTLIILGVIIVIIIVAAGGYFYLQQQNAAKAAVATRQTATLSRGELDATVTSAGNISAPTESTLSFPTGNVLITKFNVKVGDKVKKGDVLAEEESTDLARQVQIAQTTVSSAQSNLDALKAPPTAEQLAASQAAVTSAQSNYDSAVAALAALKAPPDADTLAADRAAVASASAAYAAAAKKAGMNNDQIIVARAALDTARIALQAAQRDYDAVAYDPRVSHSTQSDALQTATIAYDSAQSAYNLALADINDTAVKSAASSLAQAKSTLNTLTTGATADKLASAQASVASAASNLASAKESLTTLQQGATQADLYTAQANLATAQVTLSNAQSALADAKLVAPFDGIVGTVDGFVGQTATAGTAVITLVDTSNLQIVLSLSEIDVANVKPGQAAQVTFDALAGKTFDGKVLSISPLGTTASGVVNYSVIVGLTNPDPSILPGMTSEATIVTASVPDAIIAPARAVRTLGNRKTMTLLFEGKEIPLIVQTGLSNETGVQIVSAATTDGTDVNLQDGDTVVLNVTTTTTPGGGGGFGGGFGGPVIVPGR